MRLKPDEAMDIRSYSGVVIRFWMYYETELGEDFVYFTVRGTDDVWYYLTNVTRWSGTNSRWRQYEMNLSDFGDVAPTNFLRIGFNFTSDMWNGGDGAFIDDIEVWGIE